MVFMANISGMLESAKAYTVLNDKGVRGLLTYLEGECGVSKESCHPSNKMWLLNKFSEFRRALGYGDESKPLTEKQFVKAIKDESPLAVCVLLNRSDVYLSPEQVDFIVNSKKLDIINNPKEVRSPLAKVIKEKIPEWHAKWESDHLKSRIQLEPTKRRVMDAL